MKRLFGFIFFLIGLVPLILIYMVKASLISINAVPWLGFALQTHDSLLISTIAFIILLLIGFVMLGRIGTGVVFMLIGLAGIVFSILTKYGIVGIPKYEIFQIFLKDNFYITTLISLVIFAFGILLLTIGRKKVTKEKS